MDLSLHILKFPYRRVLLPLARRLGWLHPDFVSYTAVVVAAFTGLCYLRAGAAPVLLVWAVALTLLRMTLNTIDGVMAINRGEMSLKGEIVNALPDRYSDLFVVAGVAFSALCRTWLGVAALASMVLVSYSGMLGKALGVSWQHHGPMGKVERLVLLMLASLVALPYASRGTAPEWLGLRATPLEWAMGLYVVLGQWTVARRVRGQVREIKKKEAAERLDPDRNRGRAVVVFDSKTGNTQAIAEEVASGLGCGARQISEPGDLSDYDLIVLGTPNIRKEPTAEMRRFQAAHPQQPRAIATFSTFGVPVWGQLTTSACMRKMERAWGTRPVARFACPGFHVKYRTYKGRPNDADRLSAFLFGLRLSHVLDRMKDR